MGFKLLPVIAPIAAYLGAEWLADSIYTIYQPFCHQRPWRSYHLYDYQLAMDARMMLMYFSMALGGTLVYVKKLKPLKYPYGLIFGLVLVFPLAIDGGIQMIAEIASDAEHLPFYESTNLIRSLTGTLFGIGIAFGILTFFNEDEEKKPGKFSSYFKHVLVTFAASVFFIIALVTSWSLTSQKYKPSHFLIDSMQRFPGYNYEITTSGEHSTIERKLKVGDEKLYLRRAEYFGKDDLIEDYMNKEN